MSNVETPPVEEEATGVFASELMARVRQIQIRTHRMMSEVLAGAYRSTLRGTGIEFEEVRPYQPGDDVRAIDWNVLARTGEPFIKTYREERQLALNLLVDTSASMDFGSARVTKRELAAEFCALIAFAAALEKDPVGLSLFDAEPGLYLPPSDGPHHVLRIVREVVAARGTPTEPAPGASPLAAASDHLGKLLGRRALVFVVSDFLDPEPEAWARVLGRLSRTHDVICVRVVDPLEERLPAAGILRLAEAESGREVEVDTRSRRVREAWGRAAAERRQAWRDATLRARADRIELSTDADVADPVVAFFQRRRRGGAA